MRLSADHAEMLKPTTIPRNTAERRVEVVAAASALDLLGRVRNELPLLLWDPVGALRFLSGIFLGDLFRLFILGRSLAPLLLLAAPQPLERSARRRRSALVSHLIRVIRELLSVLLHVRERGGGTSVIPQMLAVGEHLQQRLRERSVGRSLLREEAVDLLPNGSVRRHQEREPRAL